MSESSAHSKERRTFLGMILGGIGVIIAASFVWPLFRYLSPPVRAEGSDKVMLAKADVPIGGSLLFSYQGKPAVVLQPKAGEFVALSAVCTHLGCIVKWVPGSQEFLCPCHGGRFSANGQVLGGPPPEALASYAVVVDGDNLLIG